MRKKQLFALLMASALSVGMAPTAAFAAADTAVELGTKILMLVPQAQKNIDELTPEQIRKQMILHWREIVPYAKDRGLHVVVEDTPDLQLDFCKAEDVREVLDAVPDLELVYDSGNMILAGEDPVKYIEKFRDRIGFVHLKDMRKAPEDLMMADISKDGELMSTAPTGFGMIDLQGVIKKLDEIGYNGGMTIEFFVDDDRDYIKSLKRSREYIERI